MRQPLGQYMNKKLTKKQLNEAKSFMRVTNPEVKKWQYEGSIKMYTRRKQMNTNIFLATIGFLIGVCIALLFIAIEINN